MTEEKLAHPVISEKARSLLLGMTYGATAVTLLGLLLIRPLRISVEQSTPTVPLPAPPPVREEADPARGPLDPSTGAELSAPESGAAGRIEPGVIDPSAIEPESGPSSAAPDSPPEAAPAEANLVTPGSAGTLRVSNQTPHTVRIALLPQETAIAAQPPGSAEATGDSSGFSEAVHWDFAPGEGSLDGLRLSLPNGQQTIQAGDVLVAFAQDGSQRYWGPYVVGVTPLPAWTESGEWQLTLQSSSPRAVE